jgi:hypothetical protein
MELKIINWKAQHRMYWIEFNPHLSVLHFHRIKSQESRDAHRLADKPPLINKLKFATVPRS